MTANVITLRLWFRFTRPWRLKNVKRLALRGYFESSAEAICTPNTKAVSDRRSSRSLTARLDEPRLLFAAVWSYPKQSQRRLESVSKSNLWTPRPPSFVFWWLRKRRPHLSAELVKRGFVFRVIGNIVAFGGIVLVIIEFPRSDFACAPILPFNVAIAIRPHGVAHQRNFAVLPSELTERGMLPVVIRIRE